MLRLLSHLINSLMISKAKGMSLGKSTLYDYFSYIEDAFLAFKVPLFSESLRKYNQNPQKIYTVDTGLIHTYSPQFSQKSWPYV